MSVVRPFRGDGPTRPAAHRVLDALADERRLRQLTTFVVVALTAAIVGVVGFYVSDRYVVRMESPLDQAVRELEDRVRRQPNDAQLRYEMANAYARQGQHEAALKQYEQTLVLRPNWQPALLAIAASELRRNNERRAEEVYRQVYELNHESELRYSNPELGVVYYRLGVFASKAGRHEEAAERASEALLVDRTDADALYLLATSEEAQDKLQAAAAAFRQATTLDPNFREGFAGLHRVAVRLGDTREALYAKSMEQVAAGDALAALVGFQQLTRESPEYAEAWLGLGLAHAKRGQREEAQQAFRAALERNPNLLLAQWSLRTPEGEGGQ